MSVGDLGVPEDLRRPLDGPHPDGPLLTGFCNLPGSMRFTAGGVVTVPGNASDPDLSYLHLPVGYCAHFFANVGNARQLRFAPGGELFVASPTQQTTSGGPNGLAQIVVLPDDDQDGYGDAPLVYLNNLPATQGLLFTGGYFYYQDGIVIKRVPYAIGDRAPSAASVSFATISVYTSPLHWPKVLDVDDDGTTIYVGNGGDQGESCAQPTPFHGGILKLDGSAAPGAKPVLVAKGFRNPIAVRCHHSFGQCYAAELALDYSSGPGGGREKVLGIHAGDDWGFPCCATQNLPYQGVVDSNTGTAPVCTGTAPESSAFIIAETPFGLDFEYGKWPAPWGNNLFVVLHGAFGTWTGARVVGVPTDAMTGAPLPSSDLNGMSNLTDFATGWDDNSHHHGRPAAITFAPDGRMFLSNDTNGDIIWIAPLTL
jgi:glucose/arabinose dehydrogenase